MLDILAWINWKLSSDAGVLAIVGSANQIVFGYPRSFELIPIITFQEVNQAHAVYDDDAPITFESAIQIDLWTDDNGTTALMLAVDTVMIGLLFDCEYSADVPEPDTAMRHRVMRYRRQLTAEDVFFDLSNLVVSGSQDGTNLRLDFTKSSGNVVHLDETTLANIQYPVSGSWVLFGQGTINPYIT